MNRLVIVLTLATWFGLQSELPAQEKTPYVQSLGDLIRLDVLRYPADEKLLVESSKDKREQALYAFCQRGILGQIGLARYYSWTGNADSEICSDLLKDSAFKNALVDTPAAADYTAEAPPDELEEPDRKTLDLPRNFIWWRYQPGGKFRDAMLKEMSPDVRAKLPGIYLHVEGMMALCRPEFIKLFETPGKRKAIRKIVEDEFESRIVHIHSLLMRIEGPAMLTLKAHLRRASVDLDCQIVLALSPVERDRLLECIEKSSNLSGRIPIASKR